MIQPIQPDIGQKRAAAGPARPISGSKRTPGISHQGRNGPGRAAGSAESLRPRAKTGRPPRPNTFKGGISASEQPRGARRPPKGCLKAQSGLSAKGNHGRLVIPGPTAH